VQTLLQALNEDDGRDYTKRNFDLDSPLYTTSMLHSVIQLFQITLSSPRGDSLFHDYGDYGLRSDFHTKPMSLEDQY